MHQITATKDFKHPETRKMVRAGEATEMTADNAKLYRGLGVVKARQPAATSPVRRTTKKRATAKK
jgi:hypothetical protein